jgi:hypothetical protein
MSPLTLTATIQPGGKLTLEHLPFNEGDPVRVVIVRAPTPTDDPTEGGKYPLRGTPGVYIDPFEPACDPDDWEVLK